MRSSYPAAALAACPPGTAGDRKSTRLNSSHDQISYAVFCLKKKKKIKVVHMVVFVKETANSEKQHSVLTLQYAVGRPIPPTTITLTEVFMSTAASIIGMP